MTIDIMGVLRFREASDDEAPRSPAGKRHKATTRPVELHSKLNESVARDILGLPARGNVTKADVNRRFRLMARLWHPDRRGDTDVATEVFQRINMANRCLVSILSGDLPSQGERASATKGAILVQL